jgi:hypothetical protein
MKNKTRISIVLTLFVCSLALVAHSAFAAKPKSLVRRGWGFGDANHIHTGPGGQTVNVNQNNTANVNNSVNVSANSGGNSTDNTTGGNNSIVTGAVSFVVRIVNTINTNIIGG